MTDDVPADHPRAASLNVRHKIIEGMHKNIVAEAGLIAHGRGEAFDYLIGEKTHQFAIDAIRAAAAGLYLAHNPVISVNGNVAVLCPETMVQFSNSSGIPLEINLFYRKPKRVRAIREVLEIHGAKQIYGTEPEFFTEINEISSARRIVDSRGIAQADWVFVPLEDGDRTEGLKQENKKVITVDLNPLSRTSLKADITIVDNITRVFPLLSQNYYAITSKNQAREILTKYDNIKVIRASLETMSQDWRGKVPL